MATTPLHFGERGRRLFGVFHHPEQRRANAPAIVLCNAFGEEAIRAFRIFRVLAERLARQGFPVLRFDYFGTGDSEGGCEAAALSGFCDDILTAQEEALDMSGARRSLWIGLRLGGAAALLASGRARPKPDGLVLWEPVMSGRDWIAEVEQAHIGFIARNFDLPFESARVLTAGADAEALGFAIGPQMLSDLDQLDLLSPASAPQKVAFVKPARGSLPNATVRTFREMGADVSVIEGEEALEWNSDEAMNAFVVPAKTLDAIVAAAERWV